MDKCCVDCKMAKGKNIGCSKTGMMCSTWSHKCEWYGKCDACSDCFVPKRVTNCRHWITSHCSLKSSIVECWVESEENCKSYLPPLERKKIMENRDFDIIVDNARLRQNKLLKTKGADYTRQEKDRLSNFKRVAKAIGLDPIKVWAVYAGKHWDAIMSYVSTGKLESEAIEGRLDDLCNYLYLLEALIKDQEE